MKTIGHFIDGKRVAGKSDRTKDIFNPTTGDYSQGARGFWIEDGGIAFPVEEITIASNLGTMLSQIDAVGEELIWRGLTASPPLRVSQMTIAGE